MSGEYDVVVIGGGLAGLTAAVASARLGRRTALLTGGVLGGQLVSIDKIEGVPGFPDGVPGYDLCPMTHEQADAAGVECLMAGCEQLAAQGNRWAVVSDGNSMIARAVIIATGTALAKLGVPGEERLFGKGVSECASCDAPLLRDKVAVVVGGGDSAMQEALTLAAHVSQVVMLTRGAALTGQASYRERIAQNPKIVVRPQVEVEEILGEAKVTGLRMRDMSAGATSELQADGVFVYIGLQPNTAFLDGRVKLGAGDGIPTDGWMRTDLAGICAAGTVRSGSPCRAASSAGDGAAAAIAIDRYLTDGVWRQAQTSGLSL
jgi:thioredoxin reductase (NADPH)